MVDFYYKPKPGNINDCVDLAEYNKILAEVNKLSGKLSPVEKELCKILATRFIIFKYDKLADYYSVASKQMQEALEKLRCVIVDTDSAIKNGYLTYFDQYSGLLKEVIDESG